MIKLGLIGAGFMGSTHSACYEILSKQKDLKVTAIADLDSTKAKKAAEKFGAKVYSSAQELLDNANVNTVDICLPTYLHAEYGVKAMKKGFNVFIEKPVCLKEDEAETLLKTQAETGAKVMVGQCIRMWDEYVFLKDMIENKQYGELKTAVFKRISPRPNWSWNNWILDSNKSGSAVLDLHIHDVDYVRYILGEPDSIKVSVSRNEENIDHVFSMYSYDKGNKHVLIEGGWDYPSNVSFEMEYRVNFQKAAVVFNSGSSPSIKVYMENGEQYTPDFNQEFVAESDELGGNISSLGGYFNELKYFIECILNKSPIETAPLEEGIKSFRLIMKELEAAKK
jgi:predicted dehydrogenase